MFEQVQQDAEVKGESTNTQTRVANSVFVLVILLQQHKGEREVNLSTRKGTLVKAFQKPCT